MTEMRHKCRARTVQLRLCRAAAHYARKNSARGYEEPGPSASPASRALASLVVVPGRDGARDVHDRPGRRHAADDRPGRRGPRRHRPPRDGDGRAVWIAMAAVWLSMALSCRSNWPLGFFVGVAGAVLAYAPGSVNDRRVSSPGTVREPLAS